MKKEKLWKGEARRERERERERESACDIERKKSIKEGVQNKREKDGVKKLGKKENINI